MGYQPFSQLCSICAQRGQGKLPNTRNSSPVKREEYGTSIDKTGVPPARVTCRDPDRMLSKTCSKPFPHVLTLLKSLKG